MKYHNKASTTASPQHVLVNKKDRQLISLKNKLLTNLLLGFQKRFDVIVVTCFSLQLTTNILKYGFIIYQAVIRCIEATELYIYGTERNQLYFLFLTNSLVTRELDEDEKSIDWIKNSKSTGQKVSQTDVYFIDPLLSAILSSIKKLYLYYQYTNIFTRFLDYAIVGFYCN